MKFRWHDALARIVGWVHTPGSYWVVLWAVAAVVDASRVVQGTESLMRFVVETAGSLLLLRAVYDLAWWP
ncbi:MAG: hypothetical protein D6696_10630 [Acidobacteria bacterium]|nr:MAG: hypothetical protein D6696_10630 [Acidobacteriota bacterium]